MCFMNFAKKEKEFLEAYEKYADAIFRHCYFRVFDRDLAKDLAQDTFIRVWRYIAEGNEIKDIRAFLYKTATNRIIDESRKRRSFSLEAMQEMGVHFRQEDKERILDRLDAKEAVLLIQQLDEMYREAALLRYVEELSVKEIAELLGENENTISVRIHRGLEKLRKLLHDKQ